MIHASDLAAARSLNQAELDWLRGQGVPAEAIHKPSLLLAARVEFLAGGRFEFARGDDNAVAAIVIITRDAFGAPRDLVAWNPRTGDLGSLYGFAWALDESEIYAPRLDDDPMRVWSTPLQWLRAGRRGLCLVDEVAARWQLAGIGALAAEDHVHGLALQAALALPLPEILVPVHEAGRTTADASL
ncbi:hypothetical protein [Alsobacter soli]|uniref:hypothetical protein n=1 Tax=Alsobacter soli TaxID=2109933 RepID=UPI001304D460|nr:hypothetical protein [Alsobacter soli]